MTDLSGVHPADRDMIEGMRVWRMGPWRGRAERWDLLSTTDLGLSRTFVADLWADRIFLAGALAEALRRDPPPRSLRGPRRRAIARRAVDAVIEAARPEREAIERDLVELAEHLKERRRTAS